MDFRLNKKKLSLTLKTQLSLACEKFVGFQVCVPGKWWVKSDVTFQTFSLTSRQCKYENLIFIVVNHRRMFLMRFFIFFCVYFEEFFCIFVSREWGELAVCRRLRYLQLNGEMRCMNGFQFSYVYVHRVNSDDVNLISHVLSSRVMMMMMLQRKFFWHFFRILVVSTQRTLSLTFFMMETCDVIFVLNFVFIQFLDFLLPESLDIRELSILISPFFILCWCDEILCFFFVTKQKFSVKIKRKIWFLISHMKKLLHTHFFFDQTLL